MNRNYLDFSENKNNPYMRDVFIDEVFKHALKNKNIYFTTPDMGAPALDKFRKQIPRQFIHAGISEQNMISMAAGLSVQKKMSFVMPCHHLLPLDAMNKLNVQFLQ